MLDAFKSVFECGNAIRAELKRQHLLKMAELYHKQPHFEARNDVAFHYFYAKHIESICRLGILSKNMLSDMGFQDDDINPTRRDRLISKGVYDQVWFTNRDYIHAVHMPVFMRRTPDASPWGLGAARSC